jgi:hypothetical protein
LNLQTLEHVPATSDPAFLTQIRLINPHLVK